MCKTGRFTLFFLLPKQNKWEKGHSALISYPSLHNKCIIALSTLFRTCRMAAILRVINRKDQNPWLVVPQTFDADHKKSAKNRKNHKNRTETTTGTLALHFGLAMFAGNQLELKRWNSMPNGRLRPSGRSNGCRNSCSANPDPFIISVRNRSRMN